MKIRCIIDTRGKVNTSQAIRVSAWKSWQKALEGGEPCGGTLGSLAIFTVEMQISACKHASFLHEQKHVQDVQNPDHDFNNRSCDEYNISPFYLKEMISRGKSVNFFTAFLLSFHIPLESLVDN